MPNIRSYKELRVYQAAMDAAMQIFELTKVFPPEEKYGGSDATLVAVSMRKHR
jgi:23S rRNA-intervening sequence protein